MLDNAQRMGFLLEHALGFLLEHALGFLLDHSVFNKHPPQGISAGNSLMLCNACHLPPPLSNHLHATPSPPPAHLRGQVLSGVL